MTVAELPTVTVRYVGLWNITWPEGTVWYKTYATTAIDAKYKGIEKVREIAPCRLLIYRQDDSLQSDDTYPAPTNLSKGTVTEPTGKMAEGKAT